MTRRIWVLTTFLLHRLFFSLTGVIFVIIALVYWAVLFPPQQGTPDLENYFLIVGAFGAGMTFLVALSIASRANEAANYPLVVRLPSRVEFLTAVLLSTIVGAGLLQLLVAALALFRGPTELWPRIMEIPPVWLATNILAAVLAMHASDFVTAGWSRVYVFGLLAFLLLGQSSSTTLAPWLAMRLNNLSANFVQQGWYDIANFINKAVSWLNIGGGEKLADAMGFLFWPFRAINEAVLAGSFDANQALAPAVMLLYATILFMLAADLFANKDLDFIE
ncbi:MAG: hypothetical protein H6662_02120 [Ardenticatenaceae bacterium]|nr:hypothetical protein [Anaerolineales bacterium]MCB8920356.1 hypothetical protein [Ardenticatenaceae bacterium]MCB8989311.1 hypothetical protein [Ardenticatenaceae bacterium]